MTETLAPKFRVVHQHVARNPVAQAIARERIQQATRAFRIQLHTLADGEDVSSHVQAAAQVLQVARQVCASHGAAAESIDAALKACQELHAAGYRWDTRLVAPMNCGMADAMDVYRQATPSELQRAYLQMRGA